MTFDLTERTIQPELLDELPAQDPRAIRSRRDLRRLNRWMGNSRIMASALSQVFSSRSPQSIVELGAGDGAFMLRVAEQLSHWSHLDLTLVDQQDLLKPETDVAYQKQRWNVRSETTDVFRWLEQTSNESCDAIVTNLFLHHFPDARLKDLFLAAAHRTSVFIAVEPRRAWWSYLCSRLVPLIGCGEVTRYDAPLSVRAGFSGRELSALWPDPANWLLTERPSGPFSHLFIAQRRGKTPR